MPHYYVAHHNQPITATLLARLQAAFGPGTIAHTAMSLDAGTDARKAAAKYAASAEAVLVVIGPDWVNRVGQGNDLAGIATAYALKYQRRIVPVLIKGAMLPDAALLPESLHKVVYLSPYALNDVENDIVRLVALLQRSQQNPPLPQQPTHQPVPTSLQKPRTFLGWLLWPFRLVAWLLMSIIGAIVWLVKTIIQQALKSIIALIVTVLVFGIIGAIVVWFMVSLVQSNMDAIQALASMADSFREMLSGLSNFQNTIPPLS